MLECGNYAELCYMILARLQSVKLCFLCQSIRRTAQELDRIEAEEPSWLESYGEFDVDDVVPDACTVNE